MAGLLLVHELVRIEILHLGGKTDGVAGEIELRDLSHATLTCEHGLPDAVLGVAHAAEQAHAGHDDATLLQHLAFRTSVSNSWGDYFLVFSM
jgi:hypothetical protein